MSALIPPQHFGLFLSARRAALYLGISPSTLYVAMERDPQFPRPVSVPGRGCRMFRREDLRAWVRALRG